MCSNRQGPQRSFKPCSLGSLQHGPLPPQLLSSHLHHRSDFTGNFVLLSKKQNVTTHLKAGVLRSEWKTLGGASEALGEQAVPSQLFSSAFAHTPLPSWILEASYFL